MPRPKGSKNLRPRLKRGEKAAKSTERQRRPAACKNCLRAGPTECKAMKNWNSPCWAYVDDLTEYMRHEQERLKQLYMLGVEKGRRVL